MIAAIHTWFAKRGVPTSRSLAALQIFHQLELAEMPPTKYTRVRFNWRFYLNPFRVLALRQLRRAGCISDHVDGVALTDHGYETYAAIRKTL